MTAPVIDPRLRAALQGKNVRCVDGRLLRHDPQFDDPYLETDIGECPECEGRGCGEQAE